MGITQADAIILTAIELFIDDLRANPWILDHIFQDFTQNKYLKHKYGKKQVDSAKEWFANNRIGLCSGYINDRMETPHVSIVYDPQNEDPEHKTLGDASTETVMLLPKDIGKPISYIIKPFVPTSYDINTGEIGVPPNTKGFENLAAGMMVVNPETGEGFVILDAGDDTITIESGLLIEASQLAVVPKNMFYVARIEHTFSKATYHVVCTAHGDPQTALWLHDIVLYGLYRYREALLEANGISESVISSGRLAPGPLSQEGGEVFWERTIRIDALVEQTWIKSPQRVIESVNLRNKLNNKYIGGLSVITNLDAQSFEDSMWYTDTNETADANFKAGSKDDSDDKC